MKKFLAAVVLSCLSASVMAGTGLNCAEEGVLDNDNQMEACQTQVDDALNAAYKALQTLHKDNKDRLAALKKMQKGWMQMRDGQCEYVLHTSAGGGGAARSAMRCEIELTMQRTKELEAL